MSSKGLRVVSFINVVWSSNYDKTSGIVNCSSSRIEGWYCCIGIDQPMFARIIYVGIGAKFSFNSLFKQAFLIYWKESWLKN